MGRRKCYKSPSTLKRNMRRLLVHLYKRIKAIKTDPEKMLNKSNDTSDDSEHNLDSFLTSTPQRLRITCEECCKECAGKHQLENHKKMGHGQAALCTSSLVLKEVPKIMVPF